MTNKAYFSNLTIKGGGGFGQIALYTTEEHLLIGCKIADLTVLIGRDTKEGAFFKCEFKNVEILMAPNSVGRRAFAGCEFTANCRFVENTSES